MSTQDRIAEILTRPYSFIAVADQDDGGWVIYYPDLPGVITQADTFEEVGEMAKDALETWVAAQVEDGAPVPEPRYTSDPEWDWSTVEQQSDVSRIHRDLLTASDVAGRFGISVGRVHQIARQYDLGDIRGNTRFFTVDDVVRFKDYRQPVGRPTKVAKNLRARVRYHRDATPSMHKVLEAARQAKIARRIEHRDGDRSAS